MAKNTEFGCVNMPGEMARQYEQLLPLLATSGELAFCERCARAQYADSSGRCVYPDCDGTFIDLFRWSEAAKVNDLPDNPVLGKRYRD